MTTSKSRRVVYLHQHYRAPSDSGGTRSHEFAKRLAAAGHEVHIVTTDQTESAAPGWSSTTRDGYEVHSVGILYNNQMPNRARVWAFLRFALCAGGFARRLRGDVILATSTPLTIVIPAWVAMVGRPTRMVFEVRDLWPEMPIAMGALRNPILRGVASAMELFAYRSASHVVALSPGMRAGVLRRGTPVEKVTVVPNAADLELFRPEDDGGAWRAQHPELRDRKLVVYCGTLGRLNGVGYLVEIAARCQVTNPDIAFVVVGDGAERDEIINQASARGLLRKNFYLYEPVAKRQVPAVFAAATVVTSLFLPLREMEANSANKFFDGLAAGRPIAINYGGWQEELLRKHDAGIRLDAHDPDRAASELAALVRDSARTATMGDHARQLAEARFSRDDAAEKIRAVLEDAAARG